MRTALLGTKKGTVLCGQPPTYAALRSPFDLSQNLSTSKTCVQNQNTCQQVGFEPKCRQGLSGSVSLLRASCTSTRDTVLGTARCTHPPGSTNPVTEVLIMVLREHFFDTLQRLRGFQQCTDHSVVMMLTALMLAVVATKYQHHFPLPENAPAY